MNTIEYANMLARVAKASSRVKAILLPAYNTGATVEVGYKQNMQDWEKKAPFITFVPEFYREESDRFTCEVVMYVGLFDTETTLVNGVTTLGAYPVMNELVPALMREFKDGVRGVAPTAFIEDWRAQFRQENYPLLWCNVEITIVEPTPVGHWR